MTEITPAMRELAADMCVLPELRDMVRAGKCDAGFYVQTACKHITAAEQAARDATEVQFWQIVDRDGLSSVPSDMWAALEQIARAARNRDMWKGQCERQAEALAAIRERKP